MKTKISKKRLQQIIQEEYDYHEKKKLIKENQTISSEELNDLVMDSVTSYLGDLGVEAALLERIKTDEFLIELLNEFTSQVREDLLRHDFQQKRNNVSSLDEPVDMEETLTQAIFEAVKEELGKLK